MSSQASRGATRIMSFPTLNMPIQRSCDESVAVGISAVTDLTSKNVYSNCAGMESRRPPSIPAPPPLRKVRHEFATMPPFSDHRKGYPAFRNHVPARRRGFRTNIGKRSTVSVLSVTLSSNDGLKVMVVGAVVISSS